MNWISTIFWTRSILQWFQGEIWNLLCQGKQKMDVRWPAVEMTTIHPSEVGLRIGGCQKRKINLQDLIECCLQFPLEKSRVEELLKLETQDCQTQEKSIWVTSKRCSRNNFRPKDNLVSVYYLNKKIFTKVSLRESKSNMMNKWQESYSSKTCK